MGNAKNLKRLFLWFVVIWTDEKFMRENEMFESHLRRVKPELLADDDDLSGAKAAKQRKGVAATKKTSQVLLTAEQKYDIAAHEMEELRDEIEETKVNSEKLLDSLRASMEETDVRIA